MNKIYNYIFASILLIATWSCDPNISDTIKPDEIFIKHFGSVSKEVMVDLEVILSADGQSVEGYLLLGSTDISGDMDYLLIRTDEAGNEIWSQQYDYSDNISDIVDARSDDTPENLIIYDNNTKAAIIGTTSFDIINKTIERAYIMVVNLTDGSAKDVKVFPPIDDYSDDKIDDLIMLNSFGNDIIKDSDATFAFVGSIDTFNVKRNIFFVRVNNDFNYSDNSTVVVPYTDADNQKAVKLFYTGLEYICIGNESIGDNPPHVFYKKINLDGQGNDIKRFVTSTVVDALLNDNNGEVTILANKAQNSVVLILNKDAVENHNSDILTTEETSLGVGNSLFGILQLPSSQYVAVGTAINTTASNDEILLVNLNNGGGLTVGSEKTYGGQGEDYGVVVKANPDGSIIIGATTDFLGGSTMMTIMKTNSKGEFLR